jgi:hypothetical protein
MVATPPPACERLRQSYPLTPAQAGATAFVAEWGVLGDDAIVTGTLHPFVFLEPKATSSLTGCRQASILYL